MTHVSACPLDQDSSLDTLAPHDPEMTTGQADPETGCGRSRPRRGQGRVRADVARQCIWDVPQRKETGMAVARTLRRLQVAFEHLS